jgi:hypothetical protein
MRSTLAECRRAGKLIKQALLLICTMRESVMEYAHLNFQAENEHRGLVSGKALPHPGLLPKEKENRSPSFEKPAMSKNWDELLLEVFGHWRFFPIALTHCCT